MNRWNLSLLIGLVVLVTAVIVWQRTQPTGRERRTGPVNMTLRDLNGKQVSLSQFRGKVVMIDAWATWCGYCVEEIPNLIELQRQAEKDGTPLQIIGIAMDSDIADVRDFVAQQHFNYPILYRDNQQMRPLGKIEAFPTKFIVNKQGIVVDKIVGAVPTDVLMDHVEKYLK